MIALYIKQFLFCIIIMIENMIILFGLICFVYFHCLFDESMLD